MEDKNFPRRFTQAGRPGAYLRIVVAGDIGAGDEIQITSRPDHALSIGDIFRIFVQDRHEAGGLLSVPQLSEAWREWARQQVERGLTKKVPPGCC